MKVEYADDNIAILTDLRCAYTALGDHPEWRPQFVRTIRHPATHTKLSEKLARFAPYVICYTKIWPDRAEIERLSGFAGSPNGQRPTICIISSVGEHGLTPWMVCHNIAHTIGSQNAWVKREIMKVLGITTDNYCIAPNQAKLVNCASARLGMIPNLSELVFELFTTWMWHGQTKSDHEGLRTYGDRVFPALMEKMRGAYFWHKYRCPTDASDVEQPWVQEAVAAKPGAKTRFSRPGAFAPVMK